LFIYAGLFISIIILIRFYFASLNSIISLVSITLIFPFIFFLHSPFFISQSLTFQLAHDPVTNLLLHNL
jgi:hypothetical protein